MLADQLPPWLAGAYAEAKGIGDKTYSEYGLQDEHVKGTFQRLPVSVGGGFDPLFGLRVEKAITPKPGHHLLSVNTEFFGISLGELTERECPSVQTGTESDGTLFRVNLDITQGLVIVCGNDDVDTLDSSTERLV